MKVRVSSASLFTCAFPSCNSTFFLLLWVYCPTFRKEPTGQVWCADVIGAGRKELILVALLDEMVMSCSFEDSFILDWYYRVRQLIPFWYCARNEWEFIAIFICWYGDIFASNLLYFCHSLVELRLFVLFPIPLSLSLQLLNFLLHDCEFNIGQASALIISKAPKKLIVVLYWLLKNRVGRSVIFFFNPAVCPFIHTYPVYIFIKTEKIQAEIETHAWNIENKPYNFFLKLLYEDLLWFLMTIAQFLMKIAQ